MNLEELCRTTRETITAIFDTRRKLMSLRIGDAPEEDEQYAWFGYDEKDLQMFKQHSSKVYGVAGTYNYVVYPKG